MREIVQERLLPDTKAILRATVEIAHYHRQLLIRSKDARGYVQQRRFPATAAGSAQAHEFFWSCADQLQAAAKENL